jgi:hypothetical protein
MKNVKFVFAALLSVLFVSSVVASNDVTKGLELKSSENSLREQIVKVVSDISYTGNADVFVKFSVDVENGFSVNEVVSSDKGLAAQVKTLLSKTSLLVPTSLDGSYLLKIKFVENESLAVSVPSKESKLLEAISGSLASVEAKQGTSAKLYFLVKENTIIVKKVEGSDATLAKSISLALENSKIDGAAKHDGYYQTTVKF